MVLNEYFLILKPSGRSLSFPVVKFSPAMIPFPKLAQQKQDALKQDANWNKNKILGPFDKKLLSNTAKLNTHYFEMSGFFGLIKFLDHMFIDYFESVCYFVWFWSTVKTVGFLICWCFSKSKNIRVYCFTLLVNCNQKSRENILTKCNTLYVFNWSVCFYIHANQNSLLSSHDYDVIFALLRSISLFLPEAVCMKENFT